MFCVEKHEENSDKTLRKNIMSLLSADYTVFKSDLSIIFVKKFAYLTFLPIKQPKSHYLVQIMASFDCLLELLK